MSIRTLTVVINANERTCGACHLETGDGSPRSICQAFDTRLEIEPRRRVNSLRCQECLNSESRELKGEL